MKDYEVIATLERCVKDDCKNCPFREREDDCMGIVNHALSLIKEQKTKLEQPTPIESKIIHKYDEQLCKLNDELCKVGIEYERTQCELAEAREELTYLRAVKATAEAFLGRKIDG